MRLLRRNTTKFEYYGYSGVDSDVDDDGLHTGQPHPVYDNPKTYRGNISAPSGSAIQAFDGLEIRYTHTLIMDDPDVNINEAGYIVWKGKSYYITAVVPSINFVTIALLQRTIDNGDQRKEDDE